MPLHKAVLFVYSNSRRTFIWDQPYVQKEKKNGSKTEHVRVWRVHIHAYPPHTHTRTHTHAHTHTQTQTHTLYGKRVSELPYVYSFNSAHLVHMPQIRFVG